VEQRKLLFQWQVPRIFLSERSSLWQSDKVEVSVLQRQEECGQRAEGSLLGLGCLWDTGVMAAKGAQASPSAPSVPAPLQPGCAPGKDSSPRTPWPMWAVLPRAGRWY